MPAQRLAFLAQKDNDHNQSIHIAAMHGSIEFLTKLVDMGAPVNIPNLTHRTPLLISISARLDSTDQLLKDRLLETTQYLLSHKSNINDISAIGDTALHLAIRGSDEVLIKVLLMAGANANARGGVEAPIHVAVRMGSLIIVRLLLAHSANPNILTRNGDSAMHVALRASNLTFVVNIVEALVAHDADTTLRNANGLTAWELACVKGNEEVQAFFINTFSS